MKLGRALLAVVVSILVLPLVLVLSVVSVLSPAFACTNSGSMTVAASVTTSVTGWDENQAMSQFGGHQGPDDVCAPYAFGQCTWWTCMRQHMLGHTTGSFWGNGADWDTSAKNAGWKQGAVAGGIVVFEPGVEGSDPTYGHVGVIEQVDEASDHVVTSEKGATVRVYSKTYSLSNPPSGVSYWYPPGAGSPADPKAHTATPASLVVGSSDVVSKMLEWARATAADNAHGYDQASRLGPDYDCSSFVSYALKAAGLDVPVFATGGEAQILTSHGFSEVQGANVTTGEGLQAGDILLVHNASHQHTEIYAGDGNSVGAHSNEFGGITGGKTGDQTGNEISEVPLGGMPYEHVYRFGGSTTTVASQCSSSAVSGVTQAQYSGDGTHAAPDEAKRIAKQMIPQVFPNTDEEQEYQCLVQLWTRESGWRWDATNPTSGAYGIVQALPASKMSTAGSDWKDNAATQIQWGLNYIKNRSDYGSPCKAWHMWQSRSPHWY